jgi:hypothetical protein
MEGGAPAAAVNPKKLPNRLPNPYSERTLEILLIH